MSPGSRLQPTRTRHTPNPVLISGGVQNGMAINEVAQVPQATRLTTATWGVQAAGPASCRLQH
jgi:hypothetical protein